MGADARARGVARVADLAQRALDTRTLIAESQSVLTPLVPGVDELIWKTLDPATLIGTSSFTGRGEPTPPEIFTWEYLEDDYMKTDHAIRSELAQLTLDDATEGHIERCKLFRDLMRPNGLRHVVETVMRDRGGRVWGSFTLVRADGRPPFSSQELDLLRAVAPHLAVGVRRGMLVGDAIEPDGPDAPATVVVGPDLRIESHTPTAERWLAALPGGGGESLPTPAMAVACAARARSRGGLHAGDERGAGPDTTVRVRDDRGQWVVLHGAPLHGAGRDRVAVLIEPANPDRVMPLLMDAYDLTAREREVTRLVLRGRSTTQIATELFVSPHTVQEHLKHIFDKVGVRTRRELSATVFLDCYAPRVVDNARRAAAGRPLRSGPLTESVTA